MKHISFTFSVIFILFISHITGSSAANYPQTIEVNLCLNGNGPTTCQVHQVVVVSSEMNIRIRTTIPSRTYPQAGIKINTRGYLLRHCSANAKGYCVFSVSDQTPAPFTIIS